MTIKHEENPWSEAVVLICTKCSKSISTKGLREEGNTAENLKMFLKKSFKDTGDLSKIRIVTSSCIDICEDEVQALSIARANGKTETLTVHPEEDRQELLAYLRQQIK